MFNFLIAKIIRSFLLKYYLLLKNDTLWSCKFAEEIIVVDGNLIDLNSDGLLELIIIPKIINIDKNKPWLYVFKGTSSAFANDPIIYK